MNKTITFGDLFAGGGGTTTGALTVPGVKVVWALNHSDVAIKIHSKNHPETKHYKADIRVQKVEELEPVDILWASLECTQHSKAKGGKDKETGSYTLAWELNRYIEHCKPLIIFIENVSEFRKWGILENGKPDRHKTGQEYERWINSVKWLGYEYESRDLNAADYGAPTKRNRYFGIFVKKGIEINWPKQTHHKTAFNGYSKWVACRDYIDLTNEGNSIFGREVNEKIIKHKRHPLSPNTLKRIAGGIKKFAPEIWYLMSYYGSGSNCHSINEPAPVISSRNGKEGMALIKAEKIRFIQDHCQNDHHQELDEPLRPQLTRQTKQFISIQFNGNGHPERQNCSMEKPLNCVLTREKFQFISTYFNSSNHPETQNQSIDEPMNTILTANNKKAFITSYFTYNYATTSVDAPAPVVRCSESLALLTADNEFLDFDIKMRFLNVHELAAIMGFPDGYFEGISKKEAIKLIGNAVQTTMARVLIENQLKQII